ncbi:MAG TPA: response regulator [Opitutaceae bacterium]
MSSSPPFDSGLSTRMNSRPLRVLVVDGNSVNQQLWSHMLRRLDYKPLAVADGIEALAAVQQMPFDVVLMDLDLPAEDGAEVAGRIRQLSADPDHPWIIAASNGVHADAYDRAMAAGMNDFVIKSGHFENLTRAMRFAERALRASAVRDQHAA